jgi:hypothetical protein
MSASVAAMLAGFLLSAAPGPSDRAAPSEGRECPRATYWIGVERDHWLPRVRIITAGMTQQQVDAALAPEIAYLSAIAGTGGSLTIFHEYGALGVCLRHRHGEDEPRVVHVYPHNEPPAP